MIKYQAKLTKNLGAVMPLVDKAIYSEKEALKHLKNKPEDFKINMAYLKGLKLETYIKAEPPKRMSGKLWFT